MGRVSTLSSFASDFLRTQVTRLNREVAFARSFTNIVDQLQNGIIDKIMTKGFLSSTIGNTGLEDIFVNSGIISAVSSGQQFIDSQREFLVSVIDQEINPANNTGISEPLNGSIAKFVRDNLSTATDESVLGFSNRELGSSSTRNQVVPFGNPGTAGEVDRSLLDSVNSTFNRAFSISGLSIMSDPDAIFGIANQTVLELQSVLEELDSKITEADGLADDIVALSADITDDFYDVDNKSNIEESIVELQNADNQLINVRSRIFNTNTFSEGLFLSARSDVEDAEVALRFGLPTEPKLGELFNKLDRLESLLTEIQDASNRSVAIKANLELVVPFWSDTQIFASLFSGQVHNIQLEIRSLIESMEALLDNTQKRAVAPLITTWRSQLLLLVQTMAALPSEVSEYLNTDPGGFKADQESLAADLVLIPDFDASLIVSQGAAFISEVRKKITIPVDQSIIVAFSVALKNELAKGTVYASDMTAVIGTFTPPSSEAQELGENLINSFESLGLDRASDLLRQSNFEDFFELTAETATFTGALLSEINALIACLESQVIVGLARSGLTLLQQMQDVIFNIKRGEDLIATTLGRFRDLAINNIIGRELPILKQIRDSINRVAGILGGTFCDC